MAGGSQWSVNEEASRNCWYSAEAHWPLRSEWLPRTLIDQEGAVAGFRIVPDAESLEAIVKMNSGSTKALACRLTGIKDSHGSDGGVLVMDWYHEPSH